MDDTPEFNLGAVPFTDSFVEEPVFQDITIHPSSKKLHSMDQTTNKYGRYLTNICISHNLRFLNGRMQGDMLGQFTCHKFNGASTIDYLILSHDDSFDPNNYRGISVSSCLGKLFTLIMNERLIKFLDDKIILSDCQIGFKRNYRTSDHIFILNTVLNSYFSIGKRVYACFVDFPKIYDSVWRVGLLYKLILNGLSTKFIHLIKIHV